MEENLEPSNKVNNEILENNKKNNSLEIKETESTGCIYEGKIHG